MSGEDEALLAEQDQKGRGHERERVIRDALADPLGPMPEQADDVLTDGTLTRIYLKPTNDDLHNRFTYHPPSEAGVAKHEMLAGAFTDLAILVRDLCPQGDDLNTALRDLEAAKMRASAAIARNPETR